ncbi:MAG TPA: glutamine amidotransferase [Bryobacteraceae bacterium]|nr:glutamine amidotransferase [Bryobacteraceae bacterium]
MFEFLFKYPRTAFSKGTFVLLAQWPVWALLLTIVAAAAALAYVIWRRRRAVAPSIRGPRTVIVWLLQSALVCLLLFLLWQPALSISTLRPQQNIVAVVIDDSRSMSLSEDGSSRRDQVTKTLNGGLLRSLQAKFQVRLYRFGDHVERVEKLDQFTASAPATRIGDSLKEVVADAASLPIGAVVLMSDGADNSGGIDLETISEIKRQRIPIHTIGFGREKMDRDIELTDVQLPRKSLAKSRLEAQVSFRQVGFRGEKVHLAVRESGKVLAARDIVLKGDGAAQTEAVLFNAGDAGVKNLEFSIDPLPTEENRLNNSQTRVLNVDSSTPRILYMEGEPRWDYKFLRRAVEDDKNIALYSIVRTTQNKNYTQTPDDKHPELKEAFPFPSKVEDLFDFQGLILGSIEANYFTPQQQDLIQQFVDRRGGGLLFLGGRAALAEGGYEKTPWDDLLPVHLPNHKGTFHREHANAELTPSGRDSLITRIEEDPNANVARWKKLPYLLSYQEVGTPKPGATVLADMTVPGHPTMPLLVTQKYGRGRTAVFATGSDWTWQMLQPLEDMSHEIFWRQMLRWLVSDTPTRVVASTPTAMLEDDGHVRLRAEVRDTTYLPTSDAEVRARVVGPDGSSQTVDLHPDPVEQGVYVADWDAERPGSYITEITAHRGQQDLGRDVVTFRRENGIAENFHLEQNRELLEKLSSQTGGRYYRPSEVSRLGEDISYSDAGITVRETRDLWDMPAIFFFALLLCCAEWLLRRRWGVV